MLNWQIIFCVWLVFTTAASLLYRRFAVKSELDPLTSGVIRATTVSLPAMLAIVILTGDFYIPAYSVLAISCIESIIGTAYGYVSFYAIKETDTSTFTTLVKLSVVPLIILSGIFLGEGLSSSQMLGAGLLLLSSLVLGKVKMSRRGVGLMLLSIILITLIGLLSRYLVEATNVVTTLTLSFGFGLVFKLIPSYKNLYTQKEQIKKELPMIIGLGLVAFPQILLLMWATDLADNLSLLSALASAKVVTVAIAAAIFLKERDNIKIKLLAALLAMVGSMLI